VTDDDASDLAPPAARRRPRRSRRGLAFSVLFLLIVLIGLGAGAALFGVDSGDLTGDTAGDVSAPGEGSAASSTTTTVPPLPDPRPYKVTDGVNVRSGPGTNYEILGTVETGYDVLVVCAIDGETINGPLGPTSKWLRVVLNELKGYITGEYVATGPAINDPAVIGTCPSI
jgi:Bacterial SH3 domain